MIQYTPDRWAGSQENFGRDASAKVCQYIEENPKSALLIGLGLGFGAGLALASLLSKSGDYFSRDESFAERIGSKVADSFATVMPALWKNPFRS